MKINLNDLIKGLVYRDVKKLYLSFLYSLEDLYENVEVLPTAWNVTEFEGESSCEFLINKTLKQDVIIRHFAGGQQWRKEWWNYKT